MSKKHILLIGAAVLAAVLLIVGSAGGKFGAGVPTQVRRNHADAIGTTTVPIYLSTAFTGGGSASSSAINVEGLHNLVLSGEYTPYQAGSILQIQVQRSTDGGSTYRPYNVIEATADEVLVYTSGTVGTPFTIPGAGTSASGTAISFDLDLTLVADYIKVFAREITAGNKGTIYTRVNMQSN